MCVSCRAAGTQRIMLHDGKVLDMEKVKEKEQLDLRSGTLQAPCSFALALHVPFGTPVRGGVWVRFPSSRVHDIRKCTRLPCGLVLARKPSWGRSIGFNPRSGGLQGDTHDEQRRAWVGFLTRAVTFLFRLKSSIMYGEIWERNGIPFCTARHRKDGSYNVN